MEDKKDNVLEEKKDRRDFLLNLGKMALPAFAFLGLGVLGSKLHGSNDSSGSKTKKFNGPSGCDKGCTGGCETTCRGDCEGGCKTGCDGSCKGDCDGSCKGDCSGNSK